MSPMLTDLAKRLINGDLILGRHGTSRGSGTLVPRTIDVAIAGIDLISAAGPPGELRKLHIVFSLAEARNQIVSAP